MSYEQEILFKKSIDFELYHPSEKNNFLNNFSWCFTKNENKLYQLDMSKLQQVIRNTEMQFFIKDAKFNLDKNFKADSADLLKEALLSKGKVFLDIYYKAWDILKNYFHNPVSSLLSSKTMLLPHQVQAAITVLQRSKPRFLIADEVGLGKTIETGLILKECLLKYSFERVLICTPASILTQWQSELKEKFNEDFVILNGASLKTTDVLLQNKKIIISIDLIKDPNYRELFINKDRYILFDIIIFDEAHRLRRDEAHITKAYAFAQFVIQHCLNPMGLLLLLSATPFRGKLEEIYYLVQLLNPDLLGPLSYFLSEYQNKGEVFLRKKMSSLLIRRRKVDIGGFTKRFARTVYVQLSSIETSFYNATTEYVKQEYNSAINAGQSMKAFIMIIYQKLLDSSSYALLQSLIKRKEKLENIYFGIQTHTKTREENEAKVDIEEIEDLDDDLNLENKWLFSPTELRIEIQTLSQLIQLGQKIKEDSKIIVLKNTLNQLNKRGHEKIIIFTQFVKTQSYLFDQLKNSYKIVIFNGGMNLLEKEKAIQAFYNDKEILICTESGGEGRNLQVASSLINYDLPWSPVRIEQRIGRIHRFGQKSDVYIINFASKNTVADQVLEILHNKIKIFEDAFGESDTLLGLLEEDAHFEQSLAKFFLSKKTKQEQKQDIERNIVLAKKNLKKIESLISTEFLNYDMQAFQYSIQQKEKIESYEKKMKSIILNFLKYAQNSFGYYQNKPREFSLKYNNNMNLGSFSNKYAHENQINYFALGHPIIDKIIYQLLNQVENYLVYEYETEQEGFFICFSASLKNIKLYRRLYSFFYSTKHHQIIDTYPKKINNISVIKNENLDSIFTKWNKEFKHIFELITPTLLQDFAKFKNKVSYEISSLKENIKENYNEKDRLLEEKLEIQKGKLRWYSDPHMLGAIQRTKNSKKNNILNTQKKFNFLNEYDMESLFIEISHIAICNKK